MRNQTLIIAEAGVNHNGDLSLAKRLVAAAANAGADFVKFQTFNSENLATKYAQKADYQRTGEFKNESQLSMLKRVELTTYMHEQLIDYCHSEQIKFLSTAFDLNSLIYLVTLNLDLLKIPSGEITNLPYLTYVGRLNKRVILSTGMASLGEIESAIETLEKSGTPRSQVTVLHCSSEYPAPMKHVNLRAMVTIRDAFGVSVGYSDHTVGIECSVAAVALGARVIEKHLTIDRGLPGPDQEASLEPSEFQTMVTAIRNVERALGTGIKAPSQDEMKNRLLVRQSLVALKKIIKGEKFSPENVTTKRPGTGLSPMRWDEIMGRVADRDFDKDEQIKI